MPQGQPTLVERECDRCHLMQFFGIEYEGPDYSVGLFGGWSGWLCDPDEESIPTDWTLSERCHCAFTEAEKDAMALAVAKDYGSGYEPYNV